MNQHRLTLGIESIGEYRERGSRFIGFAFPINDEAAFARALEGIASRHPAARHLCFAYVLGERGEHHRSSDAGEPKGTAGVPILRRLQGARITEAAVVVVRYFGGTLLGKGGLARAYSEAARAALAANKIEAMVFMERIALNCPLSRADHIRSIITRSGGATVDIRFGERCELEADVPKIACEATIDLLRSAGALVDQLK